MRENDSLFCPLHTIRSEIRKGDPLSCTKKPFFLSIFWQ